MAEKPYQVTKESSSPESGSVESNLTGTEPKYHDAPLVKPSFGTRMVDSFRRDPNLKVNAKGVVGANGKVYDAEAAAVATAESPLARKLKGRHLQMIAIGGSIGMAIPWVVYSECSRICRHWSLRGVWQIPVKWRSGISLDRIYSHRYHAVLYCASPW